ncbi:hypothetical protein LIER_28796 [Lithospermum erythrorhizon]|uniref:Uncharacterized protein n=1 Tax=Lithospermum erythrorhizon TaxID=34254 RepID=A0AAV3RK67_LITER
MMSGVLLVVFPLLMMNGLTLLFLLVIIILQVMSPLLLRVRQRIRGELLSIRPAVQEGSECTAAIVVPIADEGAGDATRYNSPSDICEPSNTAGQEVSDGDVGVGQPSVTHEDSSTQKVLGRGHRTKVPYVKLQDYVTNTVRVLSPSLPSPASPSHQSSGTSYPLSDYLNSNKFSVGQRIFLASISTGIEPSSFKEAMKDPGWREAMHKEIQALEDNGTWNLVELPADKKALGSR